MVWHLVNSYICFIWLHDTIYGLWNFFLLGYIFLGRHVFRIHCVSSIGLLSGRSLSLTTGMCHTVEKGRDKNMKWYKLLVLWVVAGREKNNLIVCKIVSKLTVMIIKNQLPVQLKIIMIPVLKWEVTISAKRKSCLLKSPFELCEDDFLSESNNVHTGQFR